MFCDQKRGLNFCNGYLSWNVSTTPVTAMGCRQCLPLSVAQLKGKHCPKSHCRNGVVDTFGQTMCLPERQWFSKEAFQHESPYRDTLQATSKIDFLIRNKCLCSRL